MLPFARPYLSDLLNTEANTEKWNNSVIMRNERTSSIFYLISFPQILFKILLRLFCFLSSDTLQWSMLVYPPVPERLWMLSSLFCLTIRCISSVRRVGGHCAVYYACPQSSLTTLSKEPWVLLLNFDWVVH